MLCSQLCRENCRSLLAPMRAIEGGPSPRSLAGRDGEERTQTRAAEQSALIEPFLKSTSQMFALH